MTIKLSIDSKHIIFDMVHPHDCHLPFKIERKFISHDKLLI